MYEHDYLCHYGILGMKWGVRRFQNPDGSLTPEGRERYGSGSVFISGSSKTQDKNSGYYRAKLPRGVREKIDGYIKEGKHINVGDAPGVDRQVQDYLKKKGYKNVTVYGPGKKVRYSADENWKTKPVDKPGAKEGSKEWLAEKDKAMERDSTEGLAVILPNGGAGATRNNVERLVNSGKNVDVFQLSDKTKLLDKQVTSSDAIKGKSFDSSDLKQTNNSNLEKWGSKDNNILFVTGYSGSGKSTISDKIASKTGANVIHLDLFLEEHYKPKNSIVDGQDLEFIKYLNKHFPEYDDLTDRKKVPLHTKAFGNYLDKFESCMEGFAKEQQKQGKKVIVEGLQLLDDTFYPDKSSLKGRPLMVMKTSALKSFYRAGVRDEKLNASDLTPADLAEYIRWYSEGNSQIKHLLKCAVI